MKPTPQHDFPVSARSYAQENPFPDPNLTKRSFWLSLNNNVTLAFVPHVGNLRETSTIDVDHPRDEQEASIVLALENRYVVTPSNNKAGQEEVIDFGDDEANRIVLFFVSEAEYAQFASDLQDVGQRTGWALRSTTLLSELPEMSVLTFVRNRFLTSAHVDSHSKRMLGR
jgi:hypothetical protein